MVVNMVFNSAPWTGWAQALTGLPVGVWPAVLISLGSSVLTCFSSGGSLSCFAPCGLLTKLPPTAPNAHPLSGLHPTLPLHSWGAGWPHSPAAPGVRGLAPEKELWVQTLSSGGSGQALSSPGSLQGRPLPQEPRSRSLTPPRLCLGLMRRIPEDPPRAAPLLSPWKHRLLRRGASTVASQLPPHSLFC